MASVLYPGRKSTQHTAERSTGMFSKKPSSRLEIKVPMGVQFVFPSTANELPENELVLSGSITLTLTKPKQVDEIVVTLKNKAVIHAPGLTLDEVIMDRQWSVAELGFLQPGVHSWTFQFSIPASSAPWERTVYGKIGMKLQATISGEKINLTETEGIYLFVSPLPQGHLAPDLDFNHSAFDDTLGIYRVEFLSPAASPGSLLRCHIVFQDPPSDVYIHKLQFTCIQTFTLRSLADESKTSSPPPMKHVFRTIDTTSPIKRCTTDPPSAILKENWSSTKSKPFMKIDSRQRCSLTTLERIPNDDVLRPSTHPGTISPIQISHVLELAITFSTPDIAPKVLVLSTPLELSSCTLLPINVQVPEYEVQDPLPAAYLPRQNIHEWLESRDHVCVVPTEQLVEQSLKWNKPHAEQAILNMDNDGQESEGRRTPKGDHAIEQHRQSSLDRMERQRQRSLDRVTERMRDL